MTLRDPGMPPLRYRNRIYRSGGAMAWSWTVWYLGDGPNWDASGCAQTRLGAKAACAKARWRHRHGDQQTEEWDTA